MNVAFSWHLPVEEDRMCRRSILQGLYRPREAGLLCWRRRLTGARPRSLRADSSRAQLKPQRLISASWILAGCLASIADTRAQEPLFLEGHTGPINQIAFSPDGSRLVSASDDITVRFWSPETGQQIGDAMVQSSNVTSVTYRPGKDYVITEARQVRA